MVKNEPLNSWNVGDFVLKTVPFEAYQDEGQFYVIFFFYILVTWCKFFAFQLLSRRIGIYFTIPTGFKMVSSLTRKSLELL